MSEKNSRIMPCITGETSQPHKQGKTIGILGGMGPAATADLYRRIVESTVAMRDQDHLQVLINSYPQVPDRTSFLLGNGPDPTPILMMMACTLEQAGADFLLMACNTASAFTSRIASAIHIPLLNWVDEVSHSVATSQSKIHRLGLLATTGTVRCELYHQALTPFGIQVLLPQPRQQEQVMMAIYGPTGVKAVGRASHLARKIVEEIGASLQDDGADAILLACTELSVLFASSPSCWSLPTLDAAQLMAERAITLAGGQTKSANGLDKVGALPYQTCLAL